MTIQNYSGSRLPCLYGVNAFLSNVKHRPRREEGKSVDTPQRTDKDLVERLTPREIEVLRLVAEGCDNQTIAALLMLDRATIRTRLNELGGGLASECRAQ